MPPPLSLTAEINHPVVGCQRVALLQVSGTTLFPQSCGHYRYTILTMSSKRDFVGTKQSSDDAIDDNRLKQKTDWRRFEIRKKKQGSTYLLTPVDRARSTRWISKRRTALQIGEEVRCARTFRRLAVGSVWTLTNRDVRVRVRSKPARECCTAAANNPPKWTFLRLFRARFFFFSFFDIIFRVHYGMAATG